MNNTRLICVALIIHEAMVAGHRCRQYRCEVRLVQEICRFLGKESPLIPFRSQSGCQINGTLGHSPRFTMATVTMVQAGWELCLSFITMACSSIKQGSTSPNPNLLCDRKTAMLRDVRIWQLPNNPREVTQNKRGLKKDLEKPYTITQQKLKLLQFISGYFKIS